MRVIAQERLGLPRHAAPHRPCPKGQLACARPKCCRHPKLPSEAVRSSCTDADDVLLLPLETTKRNYAVVLNVYDLNAANDWTHGVGVGSYRVLHSTKI